MDTKRLKQMVVDFVYVNDCPHCRRLDTIFLITRIVFLIGLMVIGNHLISMTEGEVESGCCQAYRQIAGEWNNDIAFIKDSDIKPVDYNKAIKENPGVYMNFTHECPVCKKNECPTIIRTTTTTLVCPEVTCPTLNYSNRFTPEEEKWMLNYKGSIGAAPCKQAGAYDCKDDWLQYLQVPGRPKFKSRPSPIGNANIYSGYKADDVNTFCFLDLGNYFILNRTPDNNSNARWGWNDDQCKTSSLRINKL